MMSGRSTCGSASSRSGPAPPAAGSGASSLNIPLPSYCVRASPSISTCSICCGFSSTSSWTSRPSAFAAACAFGLKLIGFSKFSTSPLGAADSLVSTGSSCSTAKSGLVIGVVAAAGAAGDAAAFPFARARASAASPFMGSALRSRLNHSTASSYFPVRSASSAKPRSAMMFSRSRSRTCLKTPCAPASSFLSTKHRAYTM